MSQEDVSKLVAKDRIRDLVLLYCRGVDRRDFDLLRSLYTPDAIDDHRGYFTGSATEFIDKLEIDLPPIRHTSHHVCNHLISVEGDEAEGEVYAISYTVNARGGGEMSERVANIRYIDRYHLGSDGWRFSHRTVLVDVEMRRPMPNQLGGAPWVVSDPSVTELRSRLFARGART